MKSKSFVFLIIAVLIALYTSVKVAIHSTFWMDDYAAGLFAHVPRTAIPFFTQVSELGDKLGIGIVALFMLAWLLLKRRDFAGGAMLALSIALANELYKILKNWFVRPRPDLEHLVQVESYSYPSGHALVGMVLYFTAAYLLIEGIKSKAAKWLVALLAVVILLFIGASRIFLQVHYLSDVLGGYALGFIWAVIWIFFYHSFKQRYTKKRPS
ncbi:phosphatase PAP2 family protein [Neobacillus drentensis]|uniref:phosphatase PAP2 family protein n=1 Tax=Neobacillus drentensis TaxID=220684 RepID=UPI001F3268CD|nr:phosphatase PAP2 family protein [Neobacillus drentensis]ULT58082.1 phosphatase PAP2 family protein [Neobacillus drentensis]